MSAVWSDERIQQLEFLIAKGLSASKIAQHLGNVSRSAVLGKAMRMGLTLGNAIANRKWSQDTRSIQNRLNAGTFAPKRKPQKPQLRLVQTSGVPLIALKRGQCKWPLDLGLDAEATAHSLFCGVRATNAVYCPTHRAVAFIPTPPEKELVRSVRRYA